LYDHTRPSDEQWIGAGPKESFLLLTVNIDLPTCAVGLDVGGTKVAGGIVAFPSGRVMVRRMIPSGSQRSGEAVLEDVLTLAAELEKRAVAMGSKVLAIGVGVCELIDHAGNITSEQTIRWRGLPVRDRFARLASTIVESDVRAAALAESLFGSGKPFRFFVYVTVGTGISYCFVQEGRPYAGARGNALILSSSPLTTTCTACGTVLKPVLEEFASGPALVSRYNEKVPGKAASGEDVLAASRGGDLAAMEVTRTAGEALGVSVGFLVNVLDPEAVIVGGGLGLADGLYWNSFVASTRDHIWARDARDLPILKAALGADAGVIGAAATAVQRFAAERLYE
jgi:glucokinase